MAEKTTVGTLVYNLEVNQKKALDRIAAIEKKMGSLGRTFTRMSKKRKIADEDGHKQKLKSIELEIKLLKKEGETLKVAIGKYKVQKAELEVKEKELKVEKEGVVVATKKVKLSKDRISKRIVKSKLDGQELKNDKEGIGVQIKGVKLLGEEVKLSQKKAKATTEEKLGQLQILKVGKQLKKLDIGNRTDQIKQSAVVSSNLRKDKVGKAVAAGTIKEVNRKGRIGATKEKDQKVISRTTRDTHIKISANKVAISDSSLARSSDIDKIRVESAIAGSKLTIERLAHSAESASIGADIKRFVLKHTKSKATASDNRDTRLHLQKVVSLNKKEGREGELHSKKLEKASKN